MAESDLSEFDAKQLPKGVKCSIADLELSPEQRKTLNDALLKMLNGSKEKYRYRHATISEVLKDWGFNAGPQAISRHRRGIRGEANGCQCHL